MSVARAANVPVVLYDVPSRSSVAISDDTVARLHEASLIIGLKDATADLSRPTRLRVQCGDVFMQWSGDDATAPAHRAMGGIGCISVSANVVPALCVLMHRAWDNGDLGRFATLRDLLDRLHAYCSRRAIRSRSRRLPVSGCAATRCDCL